MKNVSLKKIRLALLATLAAPIAPAFSSGNLADQHKIITESANEAKENSRGQQYYHYGASAICLGVAFTRTLGVPDIACTVPAGTVNLSSNMLAGKALEHAEGKTDAETKALVQAGLKDKGHREFNYGSDSVSGLKNTGESFIGQAAGHYAKDGDTEKALSDTYKDTLKQNGGKRVVIGKDGKPEQNPDGTDKTTGNDVAAAGNIAASILLPPESAVMTLQPGYQEAMKIVDQGGKIGIPDVYLRTARQAIVGVNEGQVAQSWERTEKDSEQNGNTYTNNTENNLTNNQTNDSSEESHKAGNTATSAGAKKSDVCSKITNATQAVACISQNAAIQRAINDPNLNKKFKEKTGQDLKNFVGDFVSNAAQNPKGALGAIASMAQHDPSLNAGQKSALAGLLGSANGALSSAIEEGKSAIAMSKMGDKYQASNSIAAKNGGKSSAAGGANPMAAGFNMDMFGDLFKNKDKLAGKNDKLGKLNFNAARKEKIPGYGPDAWENREISIFERVETAYQETASQQGIDLSAWSLADNKKATVSSNRTPASQK